MRPHENLRKGDGYCCEFCDGPYAVFKKTVKRSKKRKDRQIAKRRIEKEINEE